MDLIIVEIPWAVVFSSESSSGEFIGLYSSDTVAIDTIIFGPQLQNVSFQRFPDGSSEWYFSSIS